MQDFRMETFLAVCRNLNYTKAAEELCITQPAVSQHIRHLEEYYGTRLFVSEGKKMVLTEAGRLLQSAGLTMRHDEYALKELMARVGATERSLHMGAACIAAAGAVRARMLRLVREQVVTQADALAADVDAGADDHPLHFVLMLTAEAANQIFFVFVSAGIVVCHSRFSLFWVVRRSGVLPCCADWFQRSLSGG